MVSLLHVHYQLVYLVSHFNCTRQQSVSCSSLDEDSPVIQSSMFVSIRTSKCCCLQCQLSFFFFFNILSSLQEITQISPIYLHSQCLTLIFHSLIYVQIYAHRMMIFVLNIWKQGSDSLENAVSNEYSLSISTPLSSLPRGRVLWVFCALSVVFVAIYGDGCLFPCLLVPWLFCFFTFISSL